MNTKRSWFALVVALLFMPLSTIACGSGEMSAEGYENSSIKHAYQHWSQGSSSSVPFLFIDVRTAEEFAEGHIKGALLIPVQELESRLAEVPHDKRVYLYCRSGRRSVEAAIMLTGAGYSNIENVVGGIISWKAAGYPVVKR